MPIQTPYITLDNFKKLSGIITITSSDGKVYLYKNDLPVTNTRVFNGTYEDCIVYPSASKYQISSQGIGMFWYGKLNTIDTPQALLSKDDNDTVAGSEYALEYYPEYDCFVWQIEAGTSKKFGGTQLIKSSTGRATISKDYLIFGFYDRINQTVTIRVNGVTDTANLTEFNLHYTNTPFSLGGNINIVDPALSGSFLKANVYSSGIISRAWTDSEMDVIENVVGIPFVGEMELERGLKINFTPKYFGGMLIGDSNSPHCYVRVLDSKTIRIQSNLVATYKDFPVTEMNVNETNILEVSKDGFWITVKLNGVAYPKQKIVGDFTFNQKGLYWSNHPEFNFNGVINEVIFYKSQPITTKPDLDGLVEWWNW